MSYFLNPDKHFQRLFVFGFTTSILRLLQLHFTASASYRDIEKMRKIVFEEMPPALLWGCTATIVFGLSCLIISALLPR